MMKWFDRWKKVETDAKIKSLERELENALVPVKPRPEFVTGLRRNLLRQNFEIDLVPKSENKNLQSGILITGGILSALLMVVTGVRGMVSVIGVIGLLISIFREDSQEATTPANLAQ
jgi:hypothetical protein